MGGVDGETRGAIPARFEKKTWENPWNETPRPTLPLHGTHFWGDETWCKCCWLFWWIPCVFPPRRKFSERSPLRKSPKSQGKDRGPPKHHVFQVFFLELFGESISVVISGCVGYNDPLKTCQKLPSQKRWRVRVVSCWIRHFWIARFEGMKSRELDSCRLELQQLSWYGELCWNYVYIYIYICL